MFIYVIKKTYLKFKIIKNYKKIMIEEFIGGREIQAAIMGNKKLGAIELNQKKVLRLSSKV